MSYHLSGRFRFLILLFGGVVVLLLAVGLLDRRSSEDGDAASESQEQKSRKEKPAAHAKAKNLPNRATDRVEVSESAKAGFGREPSNINDDGELSTESAPATLVTSEGTFPSNVGRMLGLNDKQIQEVQSSISSFRRMHEDSTAERAVLDKEASRPEEGIDVYRIPSLPDKGEVFRKALSENLARSVGDDLSKKIVGSIGSEAYGGYGKYDVTLTFSPDEERRQLGLDPNAILVNFVYSSPTKGTAILEGSATIGEFSKMFGSWRSSAQPSR